ncbi:glycosyltransferase family 4 protein [Pseudodesulfovibrio methanolicus]|uniref:Glycosyltransferase family 4 protein n=1 Tax=Pseudodesulfovibrio methanolicus TaxID=3126690 RepID=A0ABZ2IX04_9BACT
MKPPLFILDQWASPNLQAGTSKNWLYAGLGESFNVAMVNADTPFVKKRIGCACLAKALLARPMDLRREYHRQLEWAAKFPAAFKARTRRFQKALDRTVGIGATFQVGCLFGPVKAQGMVHFSYHDQNVAMVERLWPDWMPRRFSRLRERFYELERASMQAKDMVFTYSECTRRSMIEDYGLPPERVMVAPTACKIPYPDADRVLAGRKEKLLFAATEFYRKGGDLVFEAFKELRRRRPGLELVLVGVAADEPLPEGARHLGLVPFGTLMEEYLSASLILHPARHDAYPNVLKEAQACGLPAVVSDSMGIPEIVTHGETGVVMERNDVPTLVESVERLLDAPDRLHAMRERCLVDRDRFNPESCVRRIADAMREVMERAGA